MKNVKLDSVLLFALVIPFIMGYRIGPEDTPFWLFGLIFLGLLSYIVVDLLNVNKSLFLKLKNLLLWGMIIVVIGSTFVSAIITRHRTHPIDNIHDMPLQQEIAIRFLLDGKNPYEVSYFGTFLEQWHYSEKDVNPALYHFVLPPFYILFAIPFYFASNFVFGFFDARIPLLALFLFMLIIASILVKDQDKKRLFLVLLAFNPAMLPYALEGRSDTYMFAFLFFGLYLLHIKKYFASGIPIALAFAVKQSAWPILPFYFAYLFFKEKNLKKTLITISSFAVSFIAVTIPFFLWNPKAFLDSAIFYLSGSTEHSYPISGYGLGKLLESFGFIKDVYVFYPFHIWQIIICVPLLIFLVKYFKKHKDVKTLILLYGIFLFVFWYLSRYFNNSHLGYLSLIFVTTYFFPENTDA
ncbi:MAG: hypothetical protein A3D74_04440 [Candidatus Levybacteria bacterium RIFCSPHIGHO2_02_FULL_37_13]|nr:MAG: hypothetical protein A3D74_04440 [Candidatus Levybacteria bacterium RIFCSPHIGHO2_02_FULL_37_13]OGH29493.1 MAG: hypothetical protein A3E40_03940 [Candidatus Levybacteria bacterium RIFCSPHIGHO2_12_FULL_37_9]OGH37634.1 MAG: hypothetical protein A3B41_03675 [Candidatus Levybacteria bacterium RIFCSPLOWO2_01_FULL_37_26]